MADISVVIATHNRSELVRQAIDSVLAQTDPVREIIVVDDGSTDDTVEHLARYGNSIRVFTQPAAGASLARNRGMSTAKGEWIGFLDDDDVWLPEKVARQMDVVRRNPAAALVYCSDYAVDEQLRILSTRAALPENRGDVFERLLVNNFIFTSCVLAKREAVIKAGYMDPAYHFAQDWDLWLKIAAAHAVEFAPEPLVLYRQSTSGCLSRDIAAVTRLGEMQSILENGLRLNPVPAACVRRARFELERRWATSWLAEGRAGKALFHSFRAVWLEPHLFEGYRLLIYSLVPKRSRELAKQLIRRPSNPAEATTK